MGIGSRASMVHIIDFGLSKEFRNPDTHLHIPLRRGMSCGLIGTSLFASNNSHAGCKLERRDDLESLSYVLIYFLRGGLPWEGLADSNLVAQCKLVSSAEDLCAGLPVEYATLLSYSWTLPFNTKPDYDYISRLFGESVPHEGTHPVFNWDSRLAHINTLYTNPPLPMIALHIRKSRAVPICHTGWGHQCIALCQLLMFSTGSVPKSVRKKSHCISFYHTFVFKWTICMTPKSCWCILCKWYPVVTLCYSVGES